MKNCVLCGNCLTELQKIESNSIDCCVTSPPYFNLRDYGVSGQIGLELTPDEYIDNLVNVFRQVKRVLKDDGTLWIVIGDTYAGSFKGASNYPKSSKGAKQLTNRGCCNSKLKEFHNEKIKPRDLIGIPWLLAFALRNDGWYLRQDIIWSKPNPMPESVKNRCTRSHEYIFLLSKSPKYYFDNEAISEPVAKNTILRFSQNIENQKGSEIPGGIGYKKPMSPKLPRYGGNKYTADPTKFYRTKSGNLYNLRERRNKRSVWTVTKKPFKGAHFATFPPDLIEPCILAGSKPGGIILDPFFGAGTVGVVAKKNKRSFIGIEINSEYVRLAEKRINEN